MTQISDDLLAPRFAALAYPLDDSDWTEVLARAGAPSKARRKLGSRRLLALAVLAVAAIVFLVAPALGIGPPALDFFAAKPAPKRVVVQFEQLNIGNPSRMNPGVIAHQTRLVKTYRLRSGRPFPLWVAPTRTGTFCFVFGNGGGCSARHVPSRKTPGDHNASLIGLSIEGARGSTVLAGYVYDKHASRLAVELRHAPAVSVPLLWVGRPIDAGFFFYNLTWIQRKRHSVVAVVALDAHGKQLARIASIFRPRPAWSNPRKVADLSKKHVILRSGEATIAIAPSRTGGNCFWLRTAGGAGASGCAPPRYQTMPMAGGLSGPVFSAQVKPAVARVELRFEDGARTELRPVEGFVLYSISKTHWPRGHRLTTAIAYSAAGGQLARQKLDPRQIGIYPCAKPQPIGAGLTACP